MIVNATDRKIRNRFSIAASQYDQLTGLHKDIGERLIAKARECKPCRRILDVGMGTGNFTSMLEQVFPDAMVVGLDFAPGMIDRAQEKGGDFKVIQADASFLPFKDDSFDLITSNLAYQWIADLSKAFKLCHSILVEDGSLYLTMFEHNTFNELFISLDACTDKSSFKVRRLADKNQITSALKSSGFRDVRVKSEHIKVCFPDMITLIKWVKDIGANALPTDIFIGRDLLLKANDHYGAHFKDRLGVYATFEVLWVEVRR